MLRLLGIILDEVIDNEAVIQKLITILKKYKRSAKLIMYNKNVDDIELAKFVKKYEVDLINVGTKITRNITENCYYLIVENKKENELVTGYSLCFSGNHIMGLKHFEELIDSEDARKKFLN